MDGPGHATISELGIFLKNMPHLLEKKRGEKNCTYLVFAQTPMA